MIKSHKNRKVLRLNRQTVRSLTRSELMAVPGGTFTTHSLGACPTQGCGASNGNGCQVSNNSCGDCVAE